MIFGLLKENMIKMKNIILLVISLVAVTTFAEPIFLERKFGSDSVECVKNISVYREFVKQKNYADAVSPWRWAYLNCPKSSKNLYIDGSKIFKHLIKNAKGNKSLQMALIDSLMMMYDQRMTFFGQKGYVLGLKGADMIKYQPKNLEAAFSLLQQSLEIQGNKSKATALAVYFQAATKKFEAGTFTKSNVLEVYSIVSSKEAQIVAIDEGQVQVISPMVRQRTCLSSYCSPSFNFKKSLFDNNTP